MKNLQNLNKVKKRINYNTKSQHLTMLIRKQQLWKNKATSKHNKKLLTKTPAKIKTTFPKIAMAEKYLLTTKEPLTTKTDMTIKTSITTIITTIAHVKTDLLTTNSIKTGKTTMVKDNFQNHLKTKTTNSKKEILLLQAKQTM